MVLRLENVSKTYRDGEHDIEALKDINFQVNEGDMISIMGPSGSGKSTLLNIIGLMTTQTKGDLYIKDKLIKGDNADKLAEIRNKTVSFIFQDFNLIEEYNVYENIEIPLRYRGVRHKERRELIIDSLRRLDILEKMDSRVTRLSGGQRQRVAIARALVSNGEIILADEPTGALDQNTGKEIMDILKELNKEGKTIIIVTHDPKIDAQCKRHFNIVDGVLSEVV